MQSVAGIPNIILHRDHTHKPQRLCNPNRTQQCALHTENPNNYGRTSNGQPGLQEEVISSELRTYPNPCRENKVTIEFSAKQITEIRLINITGKEVYQKSFAIPENKKQVELTGIPNGIYIIRIKTDDQNLVTKKLMISKN